ARELGDGVRREEVGADSLAGHLPRDVLDPVFTQVEVQALVVVRPRAAGAVEALVLVVHPDDGPRPVDRLAGPHQHANDTAHRAPTRCRVVVVLLLGLLAVHGRAAAEGLDPGRATEHP